MPATVQPLLTRITDAESLTNWTYLGTPGTTLETDFVIQGSFCVAKQCSGAGNLRGLQYDNTTGIDFTVPDRYLYMWIFNGTPGVCDTRQAGGVRIRVGTTTTDYYEWYVDGRDTLLRGGWKRYVLDLNKTPSNVGGAGLTRTSCRYFSVLFLTTATVKGNNLGVDAMDYGRGITIIGTDEDGWEDAFLRDMGTGTNRWGVVQKEEGIYLVYGAVRIGTPTGGYPTVFTEVGGRTLVWGNPTYDISGTVQSCVNPNHFRLEVAGNASGTTYRDGIEVSSGDDSRGRAATTFQSAGPQVAFHASGSHPTGPYDMDLYGTRFRDLTGAFHFPATGSHQVSGVTFAGCGKVYAGFAKFRNCVFTDAADDDSDGAALLWNPIIDIRNSSFIANTDATNDPHGIEHTVSGTFDYTGLTFAGNDYDIEFSGGTGAVIINANLSDPTTYEITGGGTAVVINNSVLLTAIVEDEDGQLLQDIQVAVHTLAGGTELMNELTDASGTAQASYNYLGDVSINVRARKSSPGNPRYQPFYGTGLIDNNGYSTRIRLIRDTIAE